nr:hypothetical protein [Solimonas sp. SE-A11]
MQLLLEDPRLADRIDNLELLAQAEVPGIEVLMEAIDFFHAHPEATAAHLLELWRGTPKGKGVEKLLQQGAEAPVDQEKGPEPELRLILDKLTQKVIKARIQQLFDEERLRPLTAAETNEISILLQKQKGVTQGADGFWSRVAKS